jgi:hypothetical protein
LPAMKTATSPRRGVEGVGAERYAGVGQGEITQRSRLISRPTTKKYTAMSASLSQCRRSSLMAQRPKPTVSSVCHSRPATASWLHRCDDRGRQQDYAAGGIGVQEVADRAGKASAGVGGLSVTVAPEARGAETPTRLPGTRCNAPQCCPRRRHAAATRGLTVHWTTGGPLAAIWNSPQPGF